jgi:xylulokinase
LPQKIFPEILKPYDVAGTLTEEASCRYGLKQGIPVIAGGADMACGALGTGVNHPGDAAVTMGTSATFLCAISKIGEAGQGITYHPHAIPNCYYALGSHFNGGLALNWFSTLLSPNAEISYPLLDELAAKAADLPPASQGLLCLPFLVGSGSPYFSALDAAAFIGLSQTADRAVLFKSLLEGIAFNLRQSLEIFENITGLKDIRLAGGGIRIKGWDQIITNVFGRNTRVVNCPDASAVGAAVLGGFGAGIFPDMEKAVEHCLKDQRCLTVDAGEQSVYQVLYPLWIKAHDILRDISAELKRIDKSAETAK